VSTLGDLVRTSNGWTPGRDREPGAPSWSIFDGPADQDANEKRLRQGCKRLALRLNRGDRQMFVEAARRQLIEEIQAYLATRAPTAVPAQTTGFFKGIGLCILAILGGLVVGAILGKLARSNFGHLLFRSLCRGLIYRAVRAF
jgi:hypothetical protein